MAMKFRFTWFAMRGRNGNVLRFNGGFGQNAPHSEIIHLGLSGFIRPNTHRDVEVSARSLVAGSPPAAVRRDALIGNPHSLRQFAGLPEYVDGNSAARIPVAADAQPFRLDLGGDPFSDRHRAVLMECTMIAEA